MDHRQLKHFVAVVEHGNMLRAAKTIHVTQPALSKSIRALETHLGVRLLNRSPRGVSPTVYGRQLLTHAKLILNQTRHAEDDLRAITEGTGGQMRIGFGAHIAGFMLPDAILQIVEARPNLTAQIVSKPFDELLPMLRSGEIDLAIVVFPPDPPEEDLVYEPLVVNEFRTVCRPDHPLAARGKAGLRELTEHKWILFDRPKAMETLFQTRFTDEGLEPPRPVITTSSVHFLKAALHRGDYLSFVPPGLVYDELQQKSLVSIEADMPPIITRAGLVYRADDIQPTSNQELMDKLSHMSAEFDLSAKMNKTRTGKTAKGHER